MYNGLSLRDEGLSQDKRDSGRRPAVQGSRCLGTRTRTDGRGRCRHEETAIAKREKADGGVDKNSQVVEEIINLVETFCREHLNDEYALLCRRPTEKLGRKRPSPLVSGKPNTWACGIVRTIGWVNFLDDRTQSPHMKLTAIDKAFGVGESTGQGKAMLIRKMFRIIPLDPKWFAPSQYRQQPGGLDDHDERLPGGRAAPQPRVPGRGASKRADSIYP